MNITRTQRPYTPPTQAYKALAKTQESPQEDAPMSTADKVALGGTLVSMAGLATSVGTFMSMEAGFVAPFSTAEIWGGLGGMAAFVGGSVISAAALIAAKNNS